MNRRELMVGAAALGACAREAESQAPAAPFPMRRGVNLGNALEAPNEGDWGYRIEADHLAAIADAGFDGVRLPVRWDAHAAHEPPYAIATSSLLRVAAVIDACWALGLKVQLDCHHYDALSANPDSERARFLAIWRQVAEDLVDADHVIFEPLNEPNGRRWTPASLRRLQSDVLAVIRESTPNKLVVFGPGNWQNIDALRDWRPPEGDNVAVSVHYYEPHAFTHERAEWLGDDAPAFGRTWGTSADRAQVLEHIEAAARWGRERGYAMQLGEFGVNQAVALQQRAAWTRAVRDACEAQSMAWCVWDFAGSFPVWDRASGTMIPEMRDALMGA